MGNTIRELVPEWMASVHPHGRGEHFKEPSPEKIASGSSPRAWGTPISLQAVKQCIRFIPTGVGNTIHKDLRDHIAAVHPHGRGEHINSTAAKLKPIGSSPRAWGTQPMVIIYCKKTRFIPTGVGNTYTLCIRVFLYSVHPHGRGEHPSNLSDMIILLGSSPRAWGTHQNFSQNLLSLRFIPTGVGNTCQAKLFAQYQAVHPHGRGEHSLKIQNNQPAAGSSPRAWGTPDGGSCCESLLRFIPTGVGNTQERIISYGAETVHPHGRGEHVANSRNRVPISGSSPRAWGTRSGS